MAAAHVTGVFSLPDACRAVGTLCRLMAALPETGAMAALEAAPTEPDLGAGVVIAAVNDPPAVLVSGDREAVTDLHERWRARGRRARLLRVNVAAHSPRLYPLLGDFAAVQLHGAQFWIRELRAPVRFADAVGRLHRDGIDRPTGVLVIRPAVVARHCLIGNLRDALQEGLIHGTPPRTFSPESGRLL